MAYSRVRRRSYARRPSRRRTTKRTSRISRKRYTRRRPMTKKSVLNVSSRKKRDTMVGWTNNVASGSVPPQLGPSVFTISPGPQMNLWIATGRDITTNSGNVPGNVQYDATRTATNTYMRGLKHTDFFQISDSTPWIWRRICFCFRGIGIFGNGSASAPLILETTNGFVRSQNDVNTPTYNAASGIVFKGAQGSDWNSLFTAPVDTSRVDLKYDKTITFNTGGAPMSKRFSRWFPMNKTLVYDDDEFGGGEGTSQISVIDKRGMGDYYMMDIIGPAVGGTGSGTLTWSTEATLYWHER